MELILGDSGHLVLASVDWVVTDPPYGLEFMGKEWDAVDGGFHQRWLENIRLRPGGGMKVMGGTRTFHRLCAAMEGAGYAVVGLEAWSYGSGFPKSLNVGKAIDSRGGVMARQSDFAAHLRSIRPKNVSAADINNHIGPGTRSNFWAHFTNPHCQSLLPSTEKYQRLKEILPIDPQWDAYFLPKAERDVVGMKKAGISIPGMATRHTIGGSGTTDIPVTASATETARQWEGWGTALKPAWEPVVVCARAGERSGSFVGRCVHILRKPLEGTVAANVLKHGTGAINIDAGRIGTSKSTPGTPRNAHNRIFGKYDAQDGTESGHNPNIGRWPANLILMHGAGNKRPPTPNVKHGFWVDGGWKPLGRNPDMYADHGCASRFFKQVQGWDELRGYLAQLIAPPEGVEQSVESMCGFVGMARHADTELVQRWYDTLKPGGHLFLIAPDYEPTGHTMACYAEDLGFEVRDCVLVVERGEGLHYVPKASRSEREAGLVAPEDGSRANVHPTVKPVALMRRLLEGCSGRVLDPFLGSGTTGCAAARRPDIEFVGVERSEEYLAIARARVGYWAGVREQLSLF